MLRFQSTFPRGERRFLRGGSRLVSYFNPRSLVGNDVLRRAACPLLFYFNPRSLVGNDGNQNIRRNQNGNFNPRSLVGNDSYSFSCFVSSVFQSTFPRGERRTFSGDFCTCYLFQSTFPRGERQLAEALFSEYFEISIHVPSWGTTANFHKYSLFFYAINIIFLLFIIPSLFSLVLFMLLF